MTWLDHYLNYTTGNESPRSYHLWSGLSLMAALTGRRVWTDHKIFTAYPNLYVVLAGPPGVAKSTAKDLALDFVNENIKKMPICAAAITKEALVELMAKVGGPCTQQYNYADKVIHSSQMNVFGDELISLITCGGNPTGMIDFLTHIFMCKDYRETTKNKGDNPIVNPFINILVCCTINTLKQLVNQKVVSGGASRRFVFIVERKNLEPHAFVEHTRDQEESRQIIAQTWPKFQARVGPFDWEDDARPFFKSWYDNNFYRVDKCTSESLQHFLKTKPVYVMKLSMLLALADDQPLIHTVENLHRAIEIVTSVEDGAQRLFDNDGINQMASIIDDLETFIENQTEERIHIKKIYAAFYKHCKNNNTAELDQVVAQLVRLGKVKLEPAYEGQSIVNYVAKVRKANNQ